jgi:ADP-heptose:LPS heptosyltransferase
VIDVAEAREIAVLRALQLGDVLCCVPALRALRNAAPRARVTLIGLPWARELGPRLAAYVDDFLEFPGFPGLPERPCDPAALARFLAAARAKHFDLALQWHGDGRVTNRLIALLGAASTSGYYRAGHFRPDTNAFLQWRDDEHEIDRWLRAVRAFGVAAPGTALDFPLERADFAALDRLEPIAALRGRPYVCVHPGSQLESRRWPPQRFAEVGDALAAARLAVVLTGTAGEAHVTAAVARAMRAPAIDLAGRTSLGTVAALIDGARLLVANDTGVSHIAAARRTPSVIIACGSDVARWAPLDRVLHRVLHAHVDCRPCVHEQCPLEGHPCAAGVASAAAARAALSLLAWTPREPNREPQPACVA